MSTIINFGLVIVAHGRCENICDKYSCATTLPTVNEFTTEPVNCIESIANFENSSYVDKIKLHSIVPYGINNVSGYGLIGDYSRTNKVIAIREMYDKILKSYFPINPMFVNKQVYTNYNTYDFLIDLVLYNWLNGALTAQAFGSIAHISSQIDRDAYNYFKTEFFENKQYMGLQIIVKEKYSFDKKYSSEEVNTGANYVEHAEYSGIFGLGLYKTTDFTIFKHITRILPIIDGYDITLFAEKFIVNYILAWNYYILEKYDNNQAIKSINLIKMDHISDEFDDYERDESGAIVMPTRIVEINNESLYHIMFFIINFINKRTDLIDLFLELIDNSLQNTKNFEILLNDICYHLPSGPTLYYLSFACRGIWGKKTGSALGPINTLFKPPSRRTPHLSLHRTAKKSSFKSVSSTLRKGKLHHGSSSHAGGKKRRSNKKTRKNRKKRK